MATVPAIMALRPTVSNSVPYGWPGIRNNRTRPRRINDGPTRKTRGCLNLRHRGKPHVMIGAVLKRSSASITGRLSVLKIMANRLSRGAEEQANDQRESSKSYVSRSMNKGQPSPLGKAIEAFGRFSRPKRRRYPLLKTAGRQFVEGHDVELWQGNRKVILTKHAY
jgi:hypothetical protein